MIKDARKTRGCLRYRTVKKYRCRKLRDLNMLQLRLQEVVWLLVLLVEIIGRQAKRH